MIVVAQEKSQKELDLESFRSDPEIWTLVEEWGVDVVSKQYQMSRSYVFVWNQKMTEGGKKRSKNLKSVDQYGFYPIKCTLYVTNKPALDLYDYVYEQCKNEFQKRVEDVDNTLLETGEFSLSLQDQFERILGIGPYTGEGLKSEKFEDVAKERKYLQTTEERKRLEGFAKVLPRVLLKELAFRIAWHKFKREHHTTGYERLTFYPVQESQPYLAPDPSSIDFAMLKTSLEQAGLAIPESPRDMLNVFLREKHDGSNEAEPLKCKKASSSMTKTFDTVVQVPGRGPLEGAEIYFECLPNPDYQPYMYDDSTVQSQLLFKRDIADEVIRQGLNGQYVAYQLIEGRPEGITYEEALSKDMVYVDATRSANKGLCRSDIKKDKRDIFEVQVAPSSKDKTRKRTERPLAESLQRMRKDMQQQHLERVELSALKSLSVTYAQEKYAQEEGSWFDSQLNAYSSEDELINANEPLWQKQDQVMIVAAVTAKLADELATVAETVPIVEPEHVEPEHVEPELVEEQPSIVEKGKDWIKTHIIQPVEDFVQPEPEYQPTMASALHRLEKLAGQLTDKGHTKEARQIKIMLKKYSIQS